MRGFSVRTWLPVMAIFAPYVAQGKVFLHQDQALKQAFPEATTLERKTLFLTAAQTHAIEQQARVKMDSSLVTYYVARDKDRVMGTVFFDSRIVRTFKATYMVVVRPEGTLETVEILSFQEPEDYIPRANWMALFTGRGLSEGLRLRRDIPNVTGATLTCQSIVDSVRGILSLYPLTRQVS